MSDLEHLLDAKVSAQVAWAMSVRHAAELTSTDDLAERVKRDLARKEAEVRFDEASTAYEKALGEHVKHARVSDEEFAGSGRGLR